MIALTPRQIQRYGWVKDQPDARDKKYVRSYQATPSTTVNLTANSPHNIVLNFPNNSQLTMALNLAMPVLKVVTPTNVVVGKLFTLSGTWTGQTPTSLSYRLDSNPYAALGAIINSDGTWTANLLITTAGSHRITVTEAGTIESVMTSVFNVAPASVVDILTIITPNTETTAVSFNISGTWSGNQPTSINYAVDNGSFTAILNLSISGNGTWIGTATINTAGSHTITVQESSDSTATATTPSFMVNTPPPPPVVDTINVTTPGTQTTDVAFSIGGAWSGNQPVSINYALDGKSFVVVPNLSISSNGTWVGSVTISSSGSHTISVQETSDVTAIAVSGSFMVNAPLPANKITINSPAGTPNAGTAFGINGNWSGSQPTSLKFAVDNGSFATVPGLVIASSGAWIGSITILSSGSHTVTIQEVPSTTVMATTASFTVNPVPSPSPNPNPEPLPTPPSVYPPAVDLRSLDSAIYNQGNLGSCFIGSTLIPLLNGKTRTIQELAEGIEGETFWVYSIVPETRRVIAAKATAAKTGIDKELVKVKLSNNREFICTPEHRIMQRDGTYIEVKDLEIGQSVMPLYRRDNGYGYELAFNHETNRYSTTHWLSKTSIEDRPSDIKQVVIHHKDFNKRNNNPENLEYMEMSEHSRYHAQLADSNFANYRGTEQQRNDSRRTALEMHRNNPGWNLKGASKGGNAAWEKAQRNPESLARVFAAMELGRTPTVRAKAGKSIAKFYNENPHVVRLVTEKKKLRLQKAKLNNTQEWQNLVNAGKQLGGRKSLEFQIMKLGKEMLDNGIEINDINWEVFREEKTQISNFTRMKNGETRVFERRYNRFPKYTKALMVFENTTQLIEACHAYNHKIISVEKITEKSDVYCLTVPGTQNFAIDAGIFVHNCVGNAIAGMVEFVRKAQGESPDFVPSRLFVYYNARVMEGTASIDAGCAIRDGLYSTVHLGVCPESDWVYNIGAFATQPPTNAYSDALHYLTMQYSTLSYDLNDWRDCLCNGFPVVFGFTVYSSFESNTANTTGIIPMPSSSDSILGGHAVACFTGDTKISLLNGNEVEIKDLVGLDEFWVYSCTEDGSIVPGRGHSAKLTRKNANIIKITLDNGEIIKCTPDHKFMLRNGSYKEAQYLVENESLMPLYRKNEVLFDDTQYEQVLNNNTGKWEYTHRVVSPSCPSGYVRHHADFNRYNNSPNNIEIMEWNAHTKLHCDLISQRNKSDKGRERSREMMTENWSDPVWIAMMKEINRQNGIKTTSRYMRPGKFGFGEGLSKEKLSELGKIYGALNAIYLHTPEAEEKCKTTRLKKFQNDSIYRAEVQARAKQNIANYNEMIKTGEIEITEAQRNARRGNMKVAREKSDRKMTALKMAYTRFHKDKYACFDDYLATKTTNHKVAKIEHLDYEDVYDFTVDQYHNFALSAGVFVHNCMGYDDSKQWLICRNSWGTGWGDNGYFYLPYAYIKSSLAADFWTIRLEE